ncbi:MAG: hypothetical protein ACE5L6_07610 [Candidatus Bathyarchaeia archaeon]
MANTTISVRVSRELKQKLEERSLSISETVRKLLEDYVERLEKQNLAERLEDLKERVGGKINSQLIASLVREDREAR